MELSCCPLVGSSRFLAETMGTGPQGAHSAIPSPCCSTLEQDTTGSCCCLASRLCPPGLALPSREHRGGLYWPPWDSPWQAQPPVLHHAELQEPEGEE